MSYNSITENDYQIVESNSSDLYGVRLESSKWKGVIITYGKVKVRESLETGYATLNFTYQIQDSAAFQKDQLEDDKDFKNYLGDILSCIIMSKEEDNSIEE
jgi:hypothetical protein